MKTALQQAIEQIDKDIADMESHDDGWLAMTNMRITLIQLLPAEKQQTIAAYNRTWDDTGTNWTAEEYYDKIYQND